MPTFHIGFHAMGAACEVVLSMDSESGAMALAETAIAEVGRIEAKFSRYREDSVVSQINGAAGGDPVECDDETWALLDYAGELHAMSGGLFDITSGVLRRVWDFGNARIPSAAEISGVLGLIGWPDVERAEHRVRLPRAGMEIDFGGFGKEYAADRAGAALVTRGARHGYVNLAGDMRFLGPKPDGEPWMIGIQDPRARDAVIATIPMTRGGIATSGDYERYFEIDGRRYCHVLDPRTGFPVDHWRTVSVVAPLAVVAGNCTTIAMLKQAGGLAFLEASGMDYLAVDQRGDIHVKGSANP